MGSVVVNAGDPTLILQTAPLVPGDTPHSQLTLLPAETFVRQTSWFIDPVNGNDANDGSTAATALKSDDERVRRMGENPVWFASAYHLRYLNDIDTVTIGGRVAPGTQIFLHGSATDGQGQSILYTGAVDAVVALNRAGNQPIEITSNALPVSWAASGLVFSRIRLTSGTIGAKGWALKDLGAKAARCSEFNVAGSYVFPFAEPTGAATPNAGNTFVVERLTVIAKLFIHLNCGRTATASAQVIVESLDVGNEVLSGNAIVNAIFDGCIVRNASTTNGLFGQLSLDACNLAGASAAPTTWNPPRAPRIQIFGGCSTIAGTVNLQSLAVGVVQRFISQGGRIVCVAPQANDVGGMGISQIGIFDQAVANSMVVKGGALVLSTGFIIWGSGNNGFSIDIRPASQILYTSGGLTVAANFPIVSAGGDVTMANGRSSIPAFDQAASAYTAVRVLSFANIVATVGAGGFCAVGGTPNIFDPVTAGQIGIVA
jgi:hypothetical protein